MDRKAGICEDWDKDHAGAVHPPQKGGSGALAAMASVRVQESQLPNP